MYLKDLMIRRRSSSKENRAFTEKECGRQVCVTTKILFMSALHLMIPGNLHLSYENINEPWEKRSLDGVYHHPSLLFDEDGRIYMGYGFNEVRILELNDTLTAPKEGGFERLLVEEKQDAYISYEGAHFYKKTEPIIFLLSSG